MHSLVDHNTASDGQHKKQHHLQKHGAYARSAVSALHADYDGQRHDPDHVINDGGSGNSGSDRIVQPAELLQRRHGNAHRGCGNDGSDEQSAQNDIAVRASDPVKKKVNRRTHNHGHDHSHKRDARSLDTGPSHFLQIGIQTCLEHDHHDTDLGHLLQKLCFLYEAKQRRAKHEACDDLPDDLRHADPLRQKTEHLCSEQKDTQIQ